jgi:CHAT domain-containing protein/Tfp pilus assembly protein PilF
MAKSPETNLEKKQNLTNSPTFISPKFSRTTRFLAILLTAFCSLFYSYLHSPVENQALASLNEAFRLKRAIQPRISGLSYAPLDNERGNETKRFDSSALESAKKFAVTALQESETAESLHSLSRIYLAEQEFDKAQIQLEKASEIMPENAEILNDLGVVFLEKSKILTEAEGGKQLELQAKALEKFETAAELKPDFHEAFFNKAICLQTLSLPNQTNEAWQKFLTLDANSKWSEEARQNLELITANKPQNKSADELLQDFMDSFRSRNDEKAFEIVSRNREMITGKLIPQRLIFAFLESEGAAKREYLDALKYIGNLEKQKSGDPFFAEIAEYYCSISDIQFLILKDAQNSVKHGYKLTLDGKYKPAIKEFETAHKLFTKSGNTLESEYIKFWISYLLTRDNKLRKSSEILEDLFAFCEKRNYKWLSSHILAWLAFNAGFSNKYSEEIEFNKKALQLAGATSDFYNQQRILSQLSENLSKLGQYLQALDFAAEGLKFSAFPESSPRQKWRDYNTVAGIFYRRKFYSIAIAYKKESLFLDFNDSDKKNYNQPTYVDLGFIQGAKGNYEESSEYFEKSFKLAEEFIDNPSKDKAIAKTNLQLAHIRRLTGNCNQALVNYDKAVNFYESSEFQSYKYDSHKGRLLCYSNERNDSAFRREFAVISKIFQKYRTEILEEQNRNSFFDNEQDIYDIAIDYEFRQGNYENAFDYAEESRSRSLLDLIKSGGKVSDDEKSPEIKITPANSQPLKLSEFQSQIPEEVQIIQYSVLSDKILVWLITKNSFKTVQTKVSIMELEKAVGAYLDLITRKNGHFPLEEKELSAKLYQILFGQIAEMLDANKKICLIPDKILFHLPFDSLISPDDNEFIISKYSLLYSLSVNIFLICNKKLNDFNKNSSETLLSIGDPAFSQKDFKDLQKLPFAESEAKEVAAFYERKVLLREKEATKENVEISMPEADIIHFAGHYVVDEYSPLFSRLVLAENIKTNNLKDETLANYEIFGKNFSKTKLIILAACQTGVEGYYNGEGMIGASRTFLAVGIPSVVASQWSVDSEATTELMINFHKYRKIEKLSTADALRRAQLEMLKGKKEYFRHPFYWAGFLTLGGFSKD